MTMKANCSAADFARSIKASSARLPRGCGTTANFWSGLPPTLAMPLQVLKKGSVEISMDGMPSFSNSMLLSRPLELQLPQSP